jgi:hypothetical protein
MTADSAEQLWQDYLFLSKELCKFAKAGDFDLVADLMTQRGVLLTRLDAADEAKSYARGKEGKKLLTQVAALDKELRKEIVKSRNLATRGLEVNLAYSGFIGTDIVKGAFFDKTSKE